MPTTYEIFCERCGTRHVEKPTSEARGARLRGLLRNAPPASTAGGKAGANSIDGQAFLRVCLACRGYACSACWNDEAGYCLDCAPADVLIVEPASTDLSPLSPPAHTLAAAGETELSLDQFVRPAAPEGTDWPAADFARESQSDAQADGPEQGDATFELGHEPWPTPDSVVVEADALLDSWAGPDEQAAQHAFEASAETLGAVEAVGVIGEAEVAEAADESDSDLLSGGPRVPDMPLFELSALLAQFAAEDAKLAVEAEPQLEVTAAVGSEPPVEIIAADEAEPPVEMLAEVEEFATVEPEPPVEMVAELQLEPKPPVEMVAELELEPPVDMAAQVEAGSAAEANASVESEPRAEACATV